MSKITVDPTGMNLQMPLLKYFGFGSESPIHINFCESGIRDKDLSFFGTYGAEDSYKYKDYFIFSGYIGTERQEENRVRFSIHKNEIRKIGKDLDWTFNERGLIVEMQSGTVRIELSSGAWESLNRWLKQRLCLSGQPLEFNPIKFYNKRSQVHE